MKYPIIIFTISLFLVSPLRAQYLPTAVEGAKWAMVDTRHEFSNRNSILFSIEGDSIVEEITYKKLYRRTLYYDWGDQYSSSRIWPAAPYYVSNQRELQGLLRDDTLSQRLYGRFYFGRENVWSDTLIHDFSQGIGDTLKGLLFDQSAPLEISEIGFEEKFGAVRAFQKSARSYWQGIGGENYGPFSGGSYFFTNDGTNRVAYHCVGSYQDCDIVIVEPDSVPYQPTAIEGANWIIFDTQLKNDERQHRILSIRGDTLAGGLNYKKLYRRRYLPRDETNAWNALPPYPTDDQPYLLALIRDDTSEQRVYAKLVAPEYADQYPEELLIHDFSFNTGDSITGALWCGKKEVKVVEWVY